MGKNGPSHADLNPAYYPQHATTAPTGPNADDEAPINPTDPKETGPLDPSVEAPTDESVTISKEDLTEEERQALDAGEAPPVSSAVLQSEAVEPDGNQVNLATSFVPGESDSGFDPEADGGDSYDEMTKDDLQAELRSAGKPTSGTKAELIERLRNG